MTNHHQNDRLHQQELLRQFPVSRETMERLETLTHELRRWQAVKNLVGPATLEHVWTRHIADSLQLFNCAPQAKRWVDLGSGAGFPGVVLGILLREVEGGQIDLVESNGRKCAFLRHAIRVTGAKAVVHEGRIEAVMPKLSEHPIDVVTARALASLETLLEMSKNLLLKNAIGVFPKGQDWESELTQARQSWTINLDTVPSKVDDRGRILIIRSLQNASIEGLGEDNHG